jgi:uncharacterized protein YutE (UPF0331/DUF86 family)
MKIDSLKIKRYLLEVKQNSRQLKQIIEKNEILADSIELKAAKYLLIELAEAISNILQHILAKEKGIPVSGYIDTIAKGFQEKIITHDLFQKLKPFFDFRNSLIHRYWIIDDAKMIENIKFGKDDFDQFIEEIEKYLTAVPGP